MAFGTGNYRAETLSERLSEVAMARVQMYSMEWCPYCAKAKALLGAKGIEYDEVDVTDDEPAALEMVERTGQRGVPQFFIDDQWIGGYDSLAYLNATGSLDKLFGIESTVDLTKVWDVAVVGGGPAGLSAAMYAARKNLSTILIALDLGGQVGITHLVTNYPGLAGGRRPRARPADVRAGLHVRARAAHRRARGQPARRRAGPRCWSWPPARRSRPGR